MEKFYEISFAQKRSEVFLDFLSDVVEQDLLLGKYVPSEPLKTKVSEGKNYYDIVRFQDPFNFAISEKVLNLLNNNSISGWSIFEILIADARSSYYGFQVTGKCGELKRPKKPGFVVGCEFEYSTWDETDVFAPQNTASVFCTQKVKDIFEHNKVTNIELEDITTVEWYSS